MREWFSAQELAGLPGLPTTDRWVRAMALRKKWKSRKKSKGKGYQYHISSLPDLTRFGLFLFERINHA